MHEIICPHCSKAFKIDEAGYADILKQVRDGEFEQQLHDRLELAEQDKRNAVELAQARAASELQKAAAAKNTEIQELKAKLDASRYAIENLKAQLQEQKALHALAQQKHQRQQEDAQRGTYATAAINQGVVSVAVVQLSCHECLLPKRTDDPT